MSIGVDRALPLFMDVDGSLLAYPAGGEDDRRLRTVRLDRDLPGDGLYPARVRFDPDVVVALNSLVEQRLVQLIWASTWDHAANRLLVPVLGLIGAPYEVAEVGTRYGDRIIASGIWVKTLAVGHWLSENGLRDSPIVMVDDLLSNQPRGNMSPQRRSIEFVGGNQNLYIATRSESGLQLDQVAEIRAFAERFAAETLE